MLRKFNDKTLVIASHNRGKINEIKLLLAPFGLTLKTAQELRLPVPEETGKDYLENALLKARACVSATGLPCLADDSGVEVAALDFGPGVDTAPYTNLHGGHKNVFKKWQENEEIKRNPLASFICVQVLAWPDGHFVKALGSVKGRLIFPPRGGFGHGYDPVFMPDGYENTIAEMSIEEKNTCSHRFVALHKLIKLCFR